MVKSSRPSVSLLSVAREARVSRATASLVLRESPLVAASTRKRVQEAMERLGYIYNRGAANLRQKRTRTIGLVLSNIANPFFSELTAGVDDVNDASDIVCFIANSGESAERQARQLRRLREHNVDGVIICPAIGSDQTLVDDLQRLALPCVQVLRHLSSEVGDYVTADYALGIEKAVEHLVRSGRRRIMFLGSLDVHSAAQERLAGFRRAMTLYGLTDELIVPAHYNNSYDQHAFDRLMSLPDRPDAAICYNDIIALDLMNDLQRRGIMAGEAFGVIGMDDLPQARASFPSLTTLATGPREIGRTAAELLHSRLLMPGRDRECIVLPPSLVVRASCGGWEGHI